MIQTQIGSSCQTPLELLKPTSGADMTLGFILVWGVMSWCQGWNTWCGPGLGEATKPFSEVDWRGLPAQSLPPTMLISLAWAEQTTDPTPLMPSLYPQTKCPLLGLKKCSFGDLSSAQVLQVVGADLCVRFQRWCPRAPCPSDQHWVPVLCHLAGHVPACWGYTLRQGQGFWCLGERKNLLPTPSCLSYPGDKNAAITGWGGTPFLFSAVQRITLHRYESNFKALRPQSGGRFRWGPSSGSVSCGGCLCLVGVCSRASEHAIYPDRTRTKPHIFSSNVFQSKWSAGIYTEYH